MSIKSIWDRLWLGVLNALSLIKTDPSFKLFFQVVEKKLVNVFWKLRGPWKPSTSLQSHYEIKLANLPKIAIVAHIHYEEYVGILETALKTFPFPCSLLITSSNDSILERCRRTFSVSDYEVTFRKVPNRGRNLAPLFVEFSKEMKTYDLVIHVHSKKSLHTDQEIGKAWSQELWQSLLSDPGTVVRALKEFMSDKEFGIYYPLVTVVSMRVFDWADCEYIAKNWSENQRFPHIVGRFPFPAGGMFWFRPSALMPLLDSNLSYADFPPEEGQVDGTLQHALERLIGTVPLGLGFKHLVHHVRSNSLTSDTSFVGTKRER